MNFILPNVDVDTEPYIDGLTMQIHHDKHHQAYVDNLNKAIEGSLELQNKELWDILTNLDSVSEDIRLKVRNNGGGHANHSFFWKLLSSEFDQSPLPQTMDLIVANFADLETFKSKFKEAALSRFGSGWAWLVLEDEKTLTISSTPNQDTPWMEKKDAILGLDVWEHAYYLKYQNRRADYVDAFWHVLNWKQVETNLQKATSYLSSK
jgi:superoxide dismutase, Fe-Mn family